MKTELNQEVIQRLNQRLSAIIKPEQILVKENMSAHTTFRIGGAADIFVEINTAEELGRVLSLLQTKGLGKLKIGRAHV